MAVSRGLRRLFEVRSLEEELSQAALKEALSNLRELETALRTAKERERSGRRQVTASAGSADAVDKIAGLEEMRAGSRHAAVLEPRIAEKQAEVLTKRQQFLAKRTTRRQAETIIKKIEDSDAVVAGRRAQQGLDDWFLSGPGRAGQEREKPRR